MNLINILNKNVPMIILHIILMLLSFFTMLSSFYGSYIPYLILVATAAYVGMSVITFPMFIIYLKSK